MGHRFPLLIGWQAWLIAVGAFTLAETASAGLNAPTVFSMERSWALTVCTNFDTMEACPGMPRQPILVVAFYRTGTGHELVREWLKSLSREARRVIGEDIKTAQFGWPLGMPLIRKLSPQLWEVRSHLSSGIARVMFTVDGQMMVLLHGFIKKSQKTPAGDLKIARQRLADLKKE
jgi:phage-related protein